MKHPFFERLGGTAALLIGLAVLVALNAVLSGIRWRADLTEDKLYSLSDGTVELLRGLDRDVTLKFYFTSSLEGLPIPLKNYAQRVTELLREVEMYGRGRLAVETHDPRPDSDEEEWAQRYGIEPQALGMLGGGPALYIGLVAVSGSKEAALPVLSPAQEPELEYLVLRLIAEVTRARKPRIGLLSSVPVMGVGAMVPGGPGGSEPWLFATELKRLYDVVPILPSEDKLPEALDLMLVIQPVNLGEPILYEIDQYLLRGGRMLAYMDPSFLGDQEASAGFGRQPRDLSGFQRLIKAWGLEMDPSQAVADMTYATRVRTSQGAAARNVAWLSLLEDALDQNELSTRALKSLLLPVAGSFRGEPAEGLSMTVLLSSSDHAGTVPIAVAEFSDDGGAGTVTQADKSLPLAVRLQGRFKTAFPSGRPAPAAPEAGELPPLPAGDDPLAEAEAEGVVVLIGDADLLADRFGVRRVPFFGQTLHEALNDNLNLTLNLVEQLSGSPQLIGLRSRGAFSRPFTRVLALEREAQERWRREETELQAKLMATQARLNELQSAKDPNQQYIVSPEQQREVEQFRAELFQTRQALKEVRKNLRQDIERLGWRVKALNMALMPLLVGVFGLARGWRRRSR